MARIVQPGEKVDLVAFEEPMLVPGHLPAAVVLATDTELVSPEEALRRARAEAEEIIAAATTEAERLCADAEAAGRVAGETAGQREAFKAHGTAAEALRALADGVQADLASTNAELIAYVTEVALALTQRILGDMAQAQPDVMQHVIAQALDALSRRETVTVHVHPTLVEVVERERESLLQIYKDVGELRIVEDDTVQPGGCLLESETMVIDATVEHVIARLRAALGTDVAAPPAGEEA